MLNLYLAALVAVIAPNIVALVAIAALIRRDMASDGGPNSHSYSKGMDTSRTVGRNIGWANSRILGRHTLRSPDTDHTRNPCRKQT
jgi:hypothetical protein